MARKPMTWNEVCAFKAKRAMIETLTAAQIAEAEKICQEFGDGFQGIRDRVDWVKWEMSKRSVGYHPGNLKMAVQELLSSVSPDLSRRILEAA